MPENKKQPLSKVVPILLAAFSGLAVFFATLVSLTSKAHFVTVFVWTMVALIILMVPVMFWGYVVEPLWWDKLSYKSQEKVRNWGVGLFILSLFVLYPLGMFGGKDWSGTGSVNLFPQGATSKNYRLDADMEVKTGWWWSKQYTIKSVEWPDSGTSYFSGCVLGKSNFVCTDNEGRSWRIEVEQEPDMPDTSSN